jgi:predicted porin
MNMGVNQARGVSLAVAALCAFGTSAYAQSSVTISGLLETGIRYSTNQNAAGDNKFSLADGLLNPSRLAFSGNEDLGGGMKALFKLEAGLQMKDGSSVNGSINDYTDPAATQRLFGREAFVGLAGDFGKVTFGRQYTTAYVASWGFDPIYGGGLVVFAPYFGYIGLRQDNMVRYEKSAGALSFQGHYVFGEKAGSTTTGSGYGVGASYNDGNLGLSGAYQESNNDVAAAVPSKRKTAVIGGSYGFGATKATLGYIHNSFDGSPQKNDVVVASLKYADGGPWAFTGVVYHDRQKSADGKHTQLVGVADYSLSKRTTLFVEADYQKYSDALLPFGAAGKDNQAGVTAGVRHTF